MKMPRLRHIVGTKWSTCCYLNTRRLAEQQKAKEDEPAAMAGWSDKFFTP